MAVMVEGSDPEAAGLSPLLVPILVCPVDKHDLRLEGQRLICTSCGRVYPIEDGIPNMLPEDGA